MSSRPDDLLAVAEALLAENPTRTLVDAYARSVINRAYYAAFWSVRARVEERALEADPALRGSHERVISACEKGDDVEQEIGIELGNLKSERFVADYENYQHVTQTAAQHFLVTARDLVDRVKALPIASKP